MGKLDILKRDEFVGQLIKLVENISSNNTSTCFAINGSWGCGKSFVLDMFEERLSMIQSEQTYTDKYFIIRYNSWKSDYYEEPLVAIVATLIAEIEEKTKLFPDSQEKREMIGMLKATGVTLLTMVNTVIKEKTGVDFQAAVLPVINGEKTGAEEYEKAHNYDIHFGFKKVLNELSWLLQSLAEKHTIVLVVDELDRCVPEYAVKVLERLHHLTEGNTNIITVVAIDKVQLCSSVKQIFGFESPEKYLEKFFQFEVKLDKGTVSEKIADKYSDYFALFDKDIFQFEDSVEEYLQIIFEDIDIRAQEQLVSKAMLVHKLIYSERMDYSFLCMELLLTVLICVYNDTSCINDQSLLGSSINDIFKISVRESQPIFASKFNEKIKNLDLKQSRGFSGDPLAYVLPSKPSLYGAIVFTWYWMHKRNARYYIQYTTGKGYEPVAANHEKLKRFAETMYLLK